MEHRPLYTGTLPARRDASDCSKAIRESFSPQATAANLISRDMQILFWENLAETWSSLSGESPVVYSYMGEMPHEEFSQSLLYRSPSERKQPARTNFFTLDGLGKLVVYSAPAESGAGKFNLDTSVSDVQHREASPEEILDNAPCLLRKMVWLVERRIAKEKLRTDDMQTERLARGLKPITMDVAKKIRLALANTSGNMDLIMTKLHELPLITPTTA